MKNVALLALFLLCFFTLLAEGEETGEKKEQTSLKVMVVDAETQDPIPAAKVKIGQNEVEAYTDFDGLAEFKEMAKGKYDIEISFISYQKKEIHAFQLDQASNLLLVKLNP